MNVLTALTHTGAFEKSNTSQLLLCFNRKRKQKMSWFSWYGCFFSLWMIHRASDGWFFPKDFPFWSILEHSGNFRLFTASWHDHRKGNSPFVWQKSMWVHWITLFHHLLFAFAVELWIRVVPQFSYSWMQPSFWQSTVKWLHQNQFLQL